MWKSDPRHLQETILMASRSMNGGKTSGGAQWENPIVPKIPGEWGNKLLADAQSESKGPFRQRPSRSLPEGKEDRSETNIKLMQAQIAELQQVLVPTI